MDDPRRVEEMYQLASGATSRWPKLPSSRLWLIVAAMTAVGGGVSALLALVQRSSGLFFVGLLLVSAAWFVSRAIDVRCRRAITERRQALDQTGCRVMGLARHAGGISYLKTYFDPAQPVVLGLTASHFILFLNNPLRTYVMIPFPDIVDIFAGTPDSARATWDEDSVNEAFSSAAEILNIVARLGSIKTYRLVFHDFEPGTSAAFWVEQIVAARGA